MFKFFLQLIIISIFLTFSSYAKNYEKIIINGNERISNETILVFAEIQDNKFLDENSINEILKKLYKSGFFKDINVKIENNNLTEIGFFDTYPENDNAAFDGVWNVYPFLMSDNIIISDIDRGLFIIRRSDF